LGEQSGSILVRMHPDIDRDVPEAEKAIHEAAS
jgi:hypothetical protein